ncbi:hypothetical protein [Synechococcus sp. BIOS-E4-1]|uniref:hypothetical protein n=1 Tax=Synechococcus sp. BIOS-E4-1 TaxID=1400864 RepID=UPI00351C52F8
MSGKILRQTIGSEIERWVPARDRRSQAGLGLLHLECHRLEPWTIDFCQLFNFRESERSELSNPNLIRLIRKRESRRRMQRIERLGQCCGRRRKHRRVRLGPGSFLFNGCRQGILINQRSAVV